MEEWCCNVEQANNPFESHWNHDVEGYYMMFSVDDVRFRIDRTNTEIYLFNDYPDCDYIFRWISNDESSGTGYRVWRSVVDNAFGEGAFDMLTQQMVNRDFNLCDQQIPDDSDFDAYESAFNKPLLPRQIHGQIDLIIEQAFKNFDAEWDYFQDEEGWGSDNGQSKI